MTNKSLKLSPDGRGGGGGLAFGGGDVRYCWQPAVVLWMDVMDGCGDAIAAACASSRAATLLGEDGASQ
jgi:hypothetical protein